MTYKLIKGPFVSDLLKKIKDYLSSRILQWEHKENPSAQKLATMNALNRRKNTRIKFAHIGAVGDLPRIFYQSDEMIIGNISTGGLLIIDDNEKLGHTVGTYVYLTLMWDDISIEVKSRMVGAQFQRRHIQFSDFQPAAFVRISQAIKPGFLGSRFHLVKDQNSMLDVSELWVGPTGESLSFPKKTGNNTGEKISALFSTGTSTLTITQNSRPFWNENNQPISKQQLSDILIMLSNFNDPSDKVKRLIEKLQEHYHISSFSKTGTGD